MDEERDEQEEQQQEQPSIMGQVAKQGINYGKQQAKNAVKEKGKEVVAEGGAKIAQLIASHPVVLAVILAIILVIVFIFVVVLFAGNDYLDEETAKDIDEITYQAVEDYCTIDETGIHMDKEGFLKSVVANLAKEGIDLNELGFGDDGRYTVIGDDNTVSGNNNSVSGNGSNTISDNSILDLDPNSEAAKYIYKFITASLAGELPYIPGSDEETQGIIKIKRRKDQNQEAKDLTYIGYEKFQNMLQTTDNNVKQEIMNYFTLDESWNLCVAKSYKKSISHYSNGTLTSTEGEYTISEVKIPYREMVSQYTVPFIFLIDLQVITQDANYVEAVSELMTKQSEIEFTIFDSITLDTDEYTYTATRNNRSKKEVQVDGEEGVSGVSRTEIVHTTSDIEEKTITVEEIDNIKANVTKAKTWIIEQETNYVIQETIEHPYGENGETVNLPDEPEVSLGSWDENRKEHYYEEIIKREWVKSGDTKTRIKPSKFMGLWSNETGTYVKGASYKPNGKDKPGKIVEYDMLKGITKDKPVMNIVTSKQSFYDLLASRPATQTHAELMKEIIEFYLSGEELEEDTFNKTAFTSMYEPSEYVEGSYNGDFDVHDESLFITDIEQLKKAFQIGYSNSKMLIANAQAFLDMQEKYKVNALFAASVSITETSAGTRGHAVDGHNNWFNIRSTLGWRRYGSPKESIMDFGFLIAQGKYYYRQGLYTVGTIGPVYCPNTSQYPTQGDNWVATTLAQISRFYGAIGIDISPIIDGGSGGENPGFSDETLGAAMSDSKFAAMLAEAKKHLGVPYLFGGKSPSTGFDCSGFVCWVINHSGVGNVGRLNANGLLGMCARVPNSEAKPGDLIFFQGTYNTPGASHVGIYIGGGQMIHAGSPVKISSIETSYWQSHFLGYGRLP